MIATPSPICCMARARRAAYSSGGKMPVKTGCAASGSARSRASAANRNTALHLIPIGCLAGLMVPIGRLHAEQVMHKEILHHVLDIRECGAARAMIRARDHQQ